MRTSNQRCLGLRVPREPSAAAAAGVGVLITATSDKPKPEQTLRTILSSAPDIANQLSMILVTIDFRDKTTSKDAIARRRSWAEMHASSLQTMADSVQQIGGGSVPVLVELADMHGSCMSEHLSQVAFRDYAGSSCGTSSDSCKTAQFWKNTVAFSWGLARMRPCVRFVVHVDNDIELVRKSGPQYLDSTSWVRRSIRILEAVPNLLSVHPLRGPGPPCKGPLRCQCRLGRDPHSGLHVTRTNAVAIANLSAAACLLTYEGPHKPGVPHFSIQAFTLDLQRFQRVWPLAPFHYPHYGPYDSNASTTQAARANSLQRFELNVGIRRHAGKVDPESLFEENALLRGLEIVYLASHMLGIEKVLITRKERLALLRSPKLRVNQSTAGS